MGAEGIAVGMATKIPPHNLGEVVDAIMFMIDRINAEQKSEERELFDTSLITVHPRPCSYGDPSWHPLRKECSEAPSPNLLPHARENL